MPLVFFAFCLGAVTSIIMMFLGLSWWAILAVYVGTGVAALLIGAVALAVATVDETEVEGYEDRPPNDQVITHLAHHLERRG